MIAIREYYEKDDQMLPGKKVRRASVILRQLRWCAPTAAISNLVLPILYEGYSC